MSIIKVAFQPQIEVDPFSGDIKGIIYQPKIPIIISVYGKLYRYKIEPFVDSGATRNLFPAEILDSLKIKLENNKKRIHYGIGGKQVISYTHKVKIFLVKYHFSTEIDFSREHRAPLLGVESFFRHFEYVNFNMLDQQLELKPISRKSKQN